MVLPDEIIHLGRERIKPFACEGFVAYGGSFKEHIMIIGEAPGENEVIQGLPFIGRAGKVLDAMLEDIGVTRQDVYITSAVKSRPFQWKEKKLQRAWVCKKYNRPPTREEVLAHAPVLDYELDRVQPRLIITLGKVGWNRVSGSTAMMSKIHGKLYTGPILRMNGNEELEHSQKSYRVFPLYHPASLLYKPSLKEEMKKDLTTLKVLLLKMLS
ncbi:hypothetical protein Q73_00790 [Bacillus coahuilensis m2-6]|nr:hypothetical protein Q73_00790 [Bacillus coahuilensis m2-6]